jgi:hypothetical protein
MRVRRTGSFGSRGTDVDYEAVRLPLKTVEAAAEWVDEVGVALLFPNLDYVLPSLWEAISGEIDVHWAVRDQEGKFESFTPPMERLWRWKDELPKRRLACIGLHVARTSSLIAPRLVAPMFALTGRTTELDDFGGLEGLERAVAEAALELGRPGSRRELRLLVGADKRTTDRAVNGLQRKLVLTNAGRTDEEPGWPSTLHDLFTRRWRSRLRRVPERQDALRKLAVALLQSNSLSVADLAASLRIRRAEAVATLAAVESSGRAVQSDEDGLPIWHAPH